MNFGKVTIPQEVYLEFLDETIPIHWDNHAYLMVFIWLVMVPICILAIRFGKPKPRFWHPNHRLGHEMGRHGSIRAHTRPDWSV